MFDAFDALAVAFILPSLIDDWRISTFQIGALLSISYVGQLLGAILMTGLAENIGRRRALQYSLFILSSLSLACAFASSYTVLTAIAAVPLIPRLGWQSMFILGTLPFFLAVFLNRLVPESPRWLISRGKLDQARTVVN